jgi:hypothetical protein
MRPSKVLPTLIIDGSLGHEEQTKTTVKYSIGQGCRRIAYFVFGEKIMALSRRRRIANP